MGKHGNGDNVPPEGDRWPDEPVGMPDLPALPEGVIIPDDLSELGTEAERIRAEFEQEEREQRERPRDLGYGPDLAELADPADRVHRETPWFAGPSARPEPSVGMPLTIMSVAVVITVVSLFAMLMSSPGARDQGGSGSPVPEVVLTDASGRATNVASLMPAAILFVESCECGELIADTVAAAPPGVTVIAVGATPPPAPADLPPGPGLVLLGDPQGELRAALGLAAPPAGAATVVVADQREIIRTTPATDTVESFADALASLTNR